MDALSKIQKGGITDTCNSRKQEDRKTELRKLGEALQHLQNKRCRTIKIQKKWRKEVEMEQVVLMSRTLGSLALDDYYIHGSEEKAEYRRKMFKVSRRAQLHGSIHV